MARLQVIFVFALIAFTIFAVVDCFRTSNEKVRGLPRLLWVALIVLITPFGGILWFTLGKDRNRSAGQFQATGPVAPDDDPAFLRQLGEEKRREETIKELERRLAELDDDSDGPKP